MLVCLFKQMIQLLNNNSKRILLLILFLNNFYGFAQENCNCTCDFSKMKEKVEANYAGFQDKTKNKKKKYQKFTASIQKKAEQLTDFKECTQLMREWLSFFKDGHLYLSVDDPSEYKETSPPTFKCLDNNFCLLKIPSFDHYYKKQLDSIVTTNHHLISSTPFLIIDLTDNTGGSDDTYEILLPYVYSKPVTLDMIELWASPDNIKKYDDLANDTTIAEDIRKQCKERADKMRLHINSFVNITGETTWVKSPDTIYSFPKKVAILIDKKNASSAEQFLLEAKQSSKVIIYGIENTSGTLDYSNLYFEFLPSNKRAVSIPTSRSLRVRANRPFDNIGISPTVKIPKAKKDKIKFITDHLTKNKTTDANNKLPKVAR